ncbi:hypothetical protein PIN31115_02712 [Pandoraea iniqua]|uniref:Uncharacterized protein n=2 Tax=Pandoraea iniqua TaxID=2508288 RepID=A0A5E4VPB0_9BURK|nr:hypothetical protein PIN31115_02712 [Pandoraea iniqua]
MPPSPARPRQTRASCGALNAFGVLCTLCTLCVLTALNAPHAHAQSIPPVTGVPADPFHQPCVEIRVTPNGGGAALPSGPPRGQREAIDPFKPRQPFQPFKRYVDLDDRCANLPEFAPTRDTDTTGVWYVSMPAHEVHEVREVHKAQEPHEPHTARVTATVSPGAALHTAVS